MERLKLNPKYKTFIEEWDYFCSKINFGDSALDNRAIVFMNMFVSMLDEVVEEVEEESKEDTLEEVEEKRITGES